MLRKFLTILIIAAVFIQCSNQSEEYPTREQKNWCVKNSDIVQRTSELTDEEIKILNNLFEAEKLYEEKTGIKVSFVQFQNKLLQNDEDILKICKIWSEIN
tara:strand:- start:970 stop:1272 length:303 start_codon:yes stop_codon:yes gene_type:complete